MKKEKAKFEIGDRVVISNDGYAKLHTINEVYYNGYVYMYGFEGTDLRCGEMYVQYLSPNNNYALFIKEADSATGNTTQAAPQRQGDGRFDTKIVRRDGHFFLYLRPVAVEGYDLIVSEETGVYVVAITETQALRLSQIGVPSEENILS